MQCWTTRITVLHWEFLSETGMIIVPFIPDVSVLKMVLENPGWSLGIVKHRNVTIIPYYLLFLIFRVMLRTLIIFNLTVEIPRNEKCGKFRYKIPFLPVGNIISKRLCYYKVSIYQSCISYKVLQMAIFEKRSYKNI